MDAFYGRIGSKKNIVKDIIKVIPKHHIYAELFVGGGSLFFGIDTSDKKVILNDLDRALMEGYSMLKNGSINPADYIMPTTLEEKNELVNKDNLSVEDSIIKRLLISRNTFSSISRGKIYKNYQHHKKLSMIDKYVAKLIPTTLMITDYKDVIELYDGKHTFFFLDPPYEESKGLYKNSNICYISMRDTLSAIKGKFLLTINDSKNIQEIFKDFYIKEIEVKGRAYCSTDKTSTIGNSIRKELFITNYII